MTNKNRSSMSQGFTLVEILVVIAIIGILAAILFPVFSRARESARLTQCKGNLKQIGLALQMYEADSGRFPVAWNGEEDKAPVGTVLPDGPGLGWAVRLLPYIKDKRLYICPSDSNFYMDGAYTDYFININVSNKSSSNISSTSRVILLCEDIGVGESAYTHNLPVSLDRHDNRSNCLFADGHVKSVSLVDSANQAGVSCPSDPRLDFYPYTFCINPTH